MLRRNIDVTVGLVNGVIGTVMGIYATRIFDHIDVPCDIERVTSRFMLSKNLYIHRKQFPLILFYAITIHKCQGLSLDAAIIDLSTDVFGDGMAYVALSCVHTLNGLHLLSFDLLSVEVSNPCINEINRLRTNFWNDLPQIRKGKGKKRKIQVTGIIDDGEPCSKNAKVYTINLKKIMSSLLLKSLPTQIFIMNYVKQLLVICQTLKKYCLIVQPCIHIHLLLLLLAGLDMVPRSYMAFLVILVHLLCI
uniref:ATP-dependent DNA helicase n=1 Tax=Amphimedon queenslandica TaxID=400682 RepID=A0A1X7UU91_AMPQE